MFQAVPPPIIRSTKLYTTIPLMLHVQFCTPDDGRRNRLKHMEHFVQINKSRNVASCWLYFGNNFISVIGFKKCSFTMGHVLEAVTAVHSDIPCNVLKLLTARRMDV